VNILDYKNRNHQSNTAKYRAVLNLQFAPFITQPIAPRFIILVDRLKH